MDSLEPTQGVHVRSFPLSILSSKLGVFHRVILYPGDTKEVSCRVYIMRNIPCTSSSMFIRPRFHCSISNLLNENSVERTRLNTDVADGRGRSWMVVDTLIPWI
jgi:hypothetical protein